MQTSSQLSPNLDNPTAFVIISQPRTGSTLICCLLNSNPNVRALVEPINPIGHKHHMQPLPNDKHLIPQLLVDRSLATVMDQMFSKDGIASDMTQDWLSKRSASKAVGFKIMIHQIMALKQKEIFWKSLVKHKAKIVVNYRQNILMQYVSDIIAARTGKSTCYDGKPITTEVMIPVASLGDNLKRIVDEQKSIAELIRKVNLPTYKLKYEEFRDNVEPIENLNRWLTGDKINLTTKMSKQNPENLKARVKNYHDLAKEVRRLGLENLLVDN